MMTNSGENDEEIKMSHQDDDYEAPGGLFREKTRYRAAQWTQVELLDEASLKQRGWTDDRIQQFIELMLRVESGAAGEESVVLPEIRKARSQKIRFPDWSRSKLKKEAVKAHNRHWKQKQASLPEGNPVKYVDKMASTEDEPRRLKRMVVNYLRHEQTDYDDLMKEFDNYERGEEAKLIFKRRLFTAIQAKFWWLADEADRQLNKGLQKHENGAKDNWAPDKAA